VEVIISRGAGFYLNANVIKKPEKDFILK